MPATNYAISKELNSEFRSGTSGSYIEAGASWYIGLSLSEIDDDGIGALEPMMGGYARILVPRDVAHWTEPSASGSLTNASPIIFPISTKHWGTVKEVFISSSSSVGTSGSYIWFHKELEVPISILRGEKVTIPANAIAINREE